MPGDAASSTKNSLFHRIIAIPSLRAAWKRVRANKGAPGGDGKSLKAFEAHLERELKRLHDDLRQGTYRPGPLRRAAIPKPDGGQRILRIPCVRDRVAQTACHIHLSARLDPIMSARSHAYRPERSVQRAIAQVRADIQSGFVWVVDADIEKFFDTVPHARLLQEMKPYVRDEGVMRLLRLWLRSFSGQGRGLAQGAPISPLLANMYLHPLDVAWARRGLRAVRYADDFVLLCRTRREAKSARWLTGQLLRQRGLRLHPEKTRIVHAAEGFTFLGERLKLVIRQERASRLISI